MPFVASASSSETCSRQIAEEAVRKASTKRCAHSFWKVAPSKSMIQYHSKNDSSLGSETALSYVSERVLQKISSVLGEGLLQPKEAILTCNPQSMA